MQTEEAKAEPIKLHEFKGTRIESEDYKVARVCKTEYWRGQLHRLIPRDL